MLRRLNSPGVEGVGGPPLPQEEMLLRSCIDTSRTTEVMCDVVFFIPQHAMGALRVKRLRLIMFLLSGNPI